MPSAGAAPTHLLLLLLLTAGASARPSTDAALGEKSGEQGGEHLTLLPPASQADGADAEQVAGLTSDDSLEGAGAGDGPDPQQDDPEASDQQFFPSFAPLFQPLGHSRPQLLFQEPAHSQRPSSLLRPQHNSFLGYHPHAHAHHQQQQPPTAFGAGYLRATATGPASGPGPGPGVGVGAGPTAAAAGAAPASNLLGSGNFGVIRGGTFYNNDDDRGVFGGGGSGDVGLLGSSYYSNGHGRPSYYNPRPQPHHHDFFANFRDFADINTPTKSSYSQYVVVYANKNATGAASAGRPKNIIEQLALLDSEPASTPTSASSAVSAPQKSKKKPLKPAKGKGTVQRHADKEGKPGRKKAPAEAPSYQKDTYEPLLALS
ncbi:uncharacterized protein LOC124796126 [Schistocerca piceifrons]|uniref:uncharacterized protein LOC124796126 n=1 Tax=Schistocerca piceifrons TaxID=274613 RepID=UPI001F5ED882|nr:uncharacterized protein LOC124796126 [Schistocerca piceifrons]